MSQTFLTNFQSKVFNFILIGYFITNVHCTTASYGAS